MNRLLALAAAVIAIIAIVLLTSRGESDSKRLANSVPPNAAPTASPAPRASSETVLSIAPGVRRQARDDAQPSRLTPLMRDFVESRDDKAIYQRLKALDKPSGEELYVMATILDRCADVTDRNKLFKRKPEWSLGGDDARARFAAALSPKAPDRAKRLAAFDAINYDECAGMEEVKVTEKDIRALHERAAAAGDPKSRIELLRLDLKDQQRDTKGEINWARPVQISDAQIETWKQAVMSGDPRAVMDGIEMIGMNFSNLHLRGPDEAPIDQFGLLLAARLAACELGRYCGADSRALQQACAMQGQCDASDYRDYVLFYGSAPGTSQRVAEYQMHLMQAIRANDWSFFTFARSPAPSFAPFQRK